MAFRSAKKNVQRAKGISASICPFALTRPGDVENVDLVIVDKIDNGADGSRATYTGTPARVAKSGDEAINQLCGTFGGNFCCINQLVRALEFVAALNRIFGSAVQLIEVNYHRAIRVLHILQGALGEAPFLQLIHGITIWNSPKLIASPRRTPTAAFDSVFQCGIERRAINPCLSAGNNF